MAKSNFSDLMILLAMGREGAKGTSQAHFFLEDQRLYLKTPSNAWYARHVDKVFIAPNGRNERILQFKDKSGVYLFEDGLATIMGPDISGEVAELTMASK